MAPPAVAIAISLASLCLSAYGLLTARKSAKLERISRLISLCSDIDGQMRQRLHQLVDANTPGTTTLSGSDSASSKLEALIAQIDNARSLLESVYRATEQGKPITVDIESIKQDLEHIRDYVDFSNRGSRTPLLISTTDIGIVRAELEKVVEQLKKLATPTRPRSNRIH